MHAEYLSFDHCCQWEVVEGVVEVVPYVVVAVLLRDLIVETVDVCDVAGLVVAPQENYHFGMLQLVQEEKEDCLDRVETTVYVVP
jgi:hypothetical protein